VKFGDAVFGELIPSDTVIVKDLVENGIADGTSVPYATGFGTTVLIV